MKITTKTGDKGFSGLYNGKRLKKSDLCFDLMGEIDELSSFLGWTKAEMLAKYKKTSNEIIDDITKIQGDLYRIMSFVGFEKNYPKNIEPIAISDIDYLEKKIEKFMTMIPQINEFLKPGKGTVSSMFHVCRTVCRRAERSFVRSMDNSTECNEMTYLNRLSDLMFVYAVFFEEK